LVRCTILSFFGSHASPGEGSRARLRARRITTVNGSAGRGTVRTGGSNEGSYAKSRTFSRCIESVEEDDWRSDVEIGGLNVELAMPTRDPRSLRLRVDGRSESVITAAK